MKSLESEVAKEKSLKSWNYQASKASLGTVYFWIDSSFEIKEVSIETLMNNLLRTVSLKIEVYYYMLFLDSSF